METTEKTIPEDFIIRVKDLTKTFYIGKNMLPVLRNITFTVKYGETVSILGSSGAGKSTLLHILGGLDKPTAGKVIFLAKDMYALPSRTRTKLRAFNIGFVFQFYHLLPELNVFENVMLPAMNRTSNNKKVSKTPLDEKVNALLDSVSLRHRAHHLPAELSGGERQRVALARALVNEPDIVLADEPTGNLDSGNGGKVLDMLFAMIRDKAHSLILVTHNIGVASRCDRVLKLEDGSFSNS